MKTSLKSSLTALLISAPLLFTSAEPQTMPNGNPMPQTEAEWKDVLTPDQFKILRKHGTERAFTGELLEENREGTFHCAGCGNALYSSETKFKSGTGWPSFYKAISEDAVGTRKDKTLWMVRTEVHCNVCKGHLGHVFNDGPKPTGKRHCINSDALTFKPKD